MQEMESFGPEGLPELQTLLYHKEFRPVCATVNGVP